MGSVPVISLVVPIYNVERYLSFCLDSLRGQSLRNIEIICVDDGSTDRSGIIADMHASVDARVRVIHKENNGLSSARNVGIKAATAEYVMFVDSDDYLEKNACAVLVECFESKHPDVITFGANCFPQVAADPWLVQCLSPEDAEYEGFSTKLLFEDHSRPYAWRTAVRRRFVIDNDLFFNEAVRFGEDQVFHFEIYPVAGKTVLLSDKLYNYRAKRKDSLMGNYARDLEIRVSNHVKIARAILEGWAKHDLIDLCPVELLDWVLDFLFTDAYKLESRDAAFSAIRSAILDSMPNAVENAEHLSPVCREIMLEILKPSDAKSISRSMLWRYTAYRLGMKRYVISTVRRPFNALCSLLRHVVPASRPYIDIQADNIKENVRMEAALDQSLSLLKVEYGAGFEKAPIGET